jgi:hypothetical protein
LSRQGKRGRRSLQGPTCELHPPTHGCVPRDADRRFETTARRCPSARTRPDGGVLPALPSGRPRERLRRSKMTLLAQRSRAVYRVYDEQEYISGAVGRDGSEQRLQSSWRRGTASAAAVALLAVGLGSVASITLLALRAPGGKLLNAHKGAHLGVIHGAPIALARKTITSGRPAPTSDRAHGAKLHRRGLTRARPAPRSIASRTRARHIARPVAAATLPLQTAGAAAKVSDHSSAVRQAEFGFER